MPDISSSSLTLTLTLTLDLDHNLGVLVIPHTGAACAFSNTLMYFTFHVLPEAEDAELEPSQSLDTSRKLLITLYQIL